MGDEMNQEVRGPSLSLKNVGNRVTGSRHQWPMAALGLTCALLLTGCASAHVIRLPKAGADTACIKPAVKQDLVVGVALSGGGSRAALFGEAGLEALGRLRAPKGSVLEQVSYLSSVSGGGLAASYYGLHKPPRETSVLGPNGAMTEAYQTFFTDFKAKLSQDFESALIWRQLGSFRFILNSALAAISLREILDERLLGPGTFADLSAREMRGDSPRLIFNTTLYNNGRRLLFSTLPPDAAQYDLFADLDKSLASRGITHAYPEVVKRRWEILLPVTPLDLQIDPCPMEVASAVTGSASAPPLVGPITFRVGKEDYYWHTGDGALYENLGLETLMFLFQKQLQEKQVRRALIISFNSGFPFSVGFRILGRRSEPWTLFNYDFSRIPSIMEERATTYWSLFYRSLQAEGVFPDDQTLGIVFLNHSHARWEDDLSDLPEACRNEKPPLTSPEDVQERIAEIPTRFVVVSECDRQLIGTAAAKVVAQNRQRIEDFVAGRRPSEEAARMAAPAPAPQQTGKPAPSNVAAPNIASPALKGKTEIQFWHALNPQSSEVIEDLVKQFNESQGEYEVKALYKGTYPEVMTAAMTAYREKNQPHIVQAFAVGTQSMVLSGAIVPIYRLMQQEKIEVNWADFLEPVTDYYSKDGKLSSMPFNVFTPILYYNKDIFKKAGLAAKPPATWQDIEDLSRKILAAGAAKCGFSAPALSWSILENTFAWHDQPFATNQNGYTGLDTKLLINGDFGLMHVGALARWQKENIFLYEFYDGRKRQTNSKFLDGDCAMFVSSSSFIADFKRSLAFDWGTGQLPHWGPPYPKPNTNLSGASLWVLRGKEPADYKGVAQFLKFITEPQQQMRWVAAKGWEPITKTAVKNLEDDGFYKKNPERLTAVRQLLNAKPTPNSQGIRLGAYLQVREAIELELQSIFTGKKTVKEALDDAVTKGNAILKEFAVTHKPWPEAL